MKVAIPSLSEKPTLKSELADCPRSAKSILIYNTANEENETVPLLEQKEPISYISTLLDLGVTDFVSGKCCKEYFDEFRKSGITVWKSSPAVDIRDMINNFLLCGAWIANDAFVPNHESIHH